MDSYTYTKDDGTKALVRCPKCDKENYVLNVLTGVCTWCGYDANKGDDKSELQN